MLEELGSADETQAAGDIMASAGPEEEPDAYTVSLVLLGPSCLISSI